MSTDTFIHDDELHSDPGVLGLKAEIRLTGTPELWKQAQLLVALPRDLTWAGQRRRRLVIAELTRRLAVD